MPLPLLAALQVFSFEGGGGREDRNFDPDAMREQRPALFADIARVAEMDSRANQVQIWGPTPLLSVLAQIQRLHKRQVLDKPCVECLLDEATDLVLAIREAARTGHKSAGGSFELYAHPHRDQQPDLVVEVGDYRLTVHTLRRPYFAVSRHPSTASLFRRLFDNRRAEARPVSGEAPYYFRKYTDDMLEAIKELRTSWNRV